MAPDGTLSVESSLLDCSWRKSSRASSTLQNAVCQATKNPAEAGFSDKTVNPASGSLERLDAGDQAALVAGGLVLVDQAARGEAIQDRLRGGEGGLGAGGVVGFERF